MSLIPSQFNAPAANELSSEVRNGLQQLLQAFDYAQDLGCSIWDFGVEIDRLLALGMTTSDLRWLVKRGYLDHAREITGSTDPDRRFDSLSQNLSFCERTCFVLSDSGLAVLRRQPGVASDDRSVRPTRSGGADLAAACGAGLPPASAGGKPAPQLAVPNWDRDSRTFMVGDHLVKQFRVPSPNQEAVLDAFQEEGWPRSIDDPLPPVPDQHPKRRLRDTIRCLNTNQLANKIRFRGDGTGQRVFWELLSTPGTNNRRRTQRAA